MKKFDIILGNPPYQEDVQSEGTNYSRPVYNELMDALYKQGETVELITPARFLFDAGGTPKAWNEKMLSDPHLKVLEYEPDCAKVFPRVSIKGGIAITCHNDRTTYYPNGMQVFVPWDEMRSIMDKVGCLDEGFVGMNAQTGSCSEFKHSITFVDECSELAARFGNKGYWRANAFFICPEAFYNEKPNDGREYVQMLGLEKTIDNGARRVWKYIRRSWITSTQEYLDYYKVFLPKANGSGTFGEVLSTPVLGTPGQASTESFLPIGHLTSREEAEHLMVYIKTKFFRAMVGILKNTQNNPAKVFKYVSQQDFTADSDIDWSKPIADIDRQLYAKYGLSQKERDFIEKNVKAMG